MAYIVSRLKQISTWSKVRQITILTYLVILLLLYAEGIGRTHFHILIGSNSEPRTRMLVAPEAIEGAMQLGLVFQGGGPNSARLSQPLEIVLDGETNYVLRLNKNAIVKLRKEKVWGVMN